MVRSPVRDGRRFTLRTGDRKIGRFYDVAFGQAQGVELALRIERRSVERPGPPVGNLGLDPPPLQLQDVAEM